MVRVSFWRDLKEIEQRCEKQIYQEPLMMREGAKVHFRKIPIWQISHLVFHFPVSRTSLSSPGARGKSETATVEKETRTLEEEEEEEAGVEGRRRQRWRIRGGRCQGSGDAPLRNLVKRPWEESEARRRRLSPDVLGTAEVVRRLLPGRRRKWPSSCKYFPLHREKERTIGRK